MVKNFNRPQTNRLIGYLLLFASFPFLGVGFTLMSSSGVTGLLGFGAFVIGAGFFVASVVWMFKKVRCPHCGALLPLKLYPISTCPYCKKRTDSH